MKCSNKISCQRNYNDYHFKGIFHFFYYGLDFLAEIDKLNEFQESLAGDDHFVCATQKTYPHATTTIFPHKGNFGNQEAMIT